jgi:hypothetical protein
VAQSYVNLLEKGKRPLTPELTRQVTNLFDLSPEKLPVSENFVVAHTDNQHLAESLAKLKYPGFAYWPSHVVKILHTYKVQFPPGSDGWIFRGEKRGRPLNLDNMSRHDMPIFIKANGSAGMHFGAAWEHG